MAFLKIISGEAEGTRLDIDSDETSIGRAPENTLVIPSAAASSRHCKIIRKGQAYTLKDLDATNGTYLNGSLVREARLAPKDTITVGGIEIVFDGEDIDAPVRPEAASSTERLEFSSQPASFSARKNSRQSWVMLIAAVSLITAAVLAYFVYRLLTA